MRAYISFEDGILPEDTGTVAIAFVCLDAEGNPVEQIDLTSDAHKMAGKAAQLVDQAFKRVVTTQEFANVEKLAVEAARLGILRPEEVEAYRQQGHSLSDAQA